jgi:cytochrome c oxidase subunit 2
MIIILTFGALMAACSSGSTDSAASLPPGDATRGADLFTQAVGGAPACSTCHTLDGTTLVGPGLEGYAETATTRVEGASALDYTYGSIVRPAAHIVSGFGNTMYNQYAQRLTPQQTADLIAYLLTL